MFYERDDNVSHTRPNDVEARGSEAPPARRGTMASLGERDGRRRDVVVDVDVDADVVVVVGGGGGERSIQAAAGDADPRLR